MKGLGMRICSVEGCEKKHWAKGYCHSCSAKYYRAQDPERARQVWRDWRDRNHEKVLANQRRRQALKRDERNAAARAKYANDPEHAERQRERVRKGRVVRTHCKNGHPWVEENIYANPNTGHRRCKLCKKTQELVANRSRSRVYKPKVKREVAVQEIAREVDYVDSVRKLRLKHWDPETGRKREVPLTDEELAAA